MEKSWKELVEMANKFKENGDVSLANQILQLALVRKVDTEAFEGLPIMEFAFHTHCQKFISDVFKDKEEEKTNDDYENWLKNG